MKYLYLFLVSFTLLSCNYNNIYTNRESDKNDAEKVSKKFYWEVLHGSNEDDIFKLFSEQFFNVTNKDKLRELISVSNNEFGEISEYNLVHWETMVVRGTNAKSEYILVYDVVRKNAKTQEKFFMINENGVIRIAGYNVNQDLNTH